jgi:hypothetical protein
VWVREWLTRRHWFGQYDSLLTELHKEDQRGYKNYLRITPDLFQEMAEKLTPRLQKQSTFMREPLQVGLKLAATLRFLATGNSYPSLQYRFRVEASTICKFMPEVCKAIIAVYKDEVLRCPKTEEEWKEIAARFISRWNYHNCLEAVDGKHIAMKKPPNAGSYYYNYKGFHSIVLMAVADATYEFLYVDVGAEGGVSDGGTWSNCSLHDAVDENRAGVPQPEPLPYEDQPVHGWLLLCLLEELTPRPVSVDKVEAVYLESMTRVLRDTQQARKIVYNLLLTGVGVAGPPWNLLWGGSETCKHWNNLVQNFNAAYCICHVKSNGSN